jgi:hypothetical protein
MTQFIMYIFVFFSLAATAQEKKVAWNYSVKPGMEEWQQFKSVDEMYKSCQIPDNIIKIIDTESLVDICFNFPAPPIYPFFNTPQEGFNSFYSNFNGIRELFNRKDAGHYLLIKYTAISLSDFSPLWELHRQGQFVSHYKFVESILSQPQIIQSLDAKERKQLLKEALRKIEEKISMTDLFSSYSLDMNMWVIGNILHSDENVSLPIKKQKNFEKALESGIFVDIDVELLYQQVKTYAYENE